MLDFVIYMWLMLGCYAETWGWNPSWNSVDTSSKEYPTIHEATSSEALVKKIHEVDGKLCVDLAENTEKEDGTHLSFYRMYFINMEDCFQDLYEIHVVNQHDPRSSGCFDVDVQRVMVYVEYKLSPPNFGNDVVIYDKSYYVPSGSEWCDICPSGYQPSFGSHNMVGECQQHETNQGESGKINAVSIEACKAECDQDNSCVAFDWVKNRCYKNSFCEKQDSDSYFSCMKKDYANVLTRYSHTYQNCIHGENIILHPGKTISECSDLCDQHPDCKAFEYGVDHDGSGSYDEMDCQLQSLAEDPEGDCDGQYYNLDLYIQKTNHGRRLSSGLRRLVKALE